MIGIDRLSLEIHGMEILKGVTFDMAAGEVFGLVGESGSGKSMTALSVMQLLPQGARTSGAARLDGRDLLTLSERDMCGLRGNDIGMIFQEPMTALNPVRSIGDQVAETLRIHGAAGRREALDLARDSPFLDHLFQDRENVHEPLRRRHGNAHRRKGHTGGQVSLRPTAPQSRIGKGTNI